MVIRIRHEILGLILLIMFCIVISIFSMEKRITYKDVIALDSNTICVPIIMYHEVKPFKVGKDVITPYEFESDLKYLAENDYTTITMSQLIDYVYNKKPLPEKPIILTFDDGYLNNYIYVFPLIKEYKAKIVFSIIGKNMDDFTKIHDDNIDYSHVTWQQLQEMLDSNYVEVQNHTYNLHSNRGRYGCMQISGESLPHYEEIMKNDIGDFQLKLTVFAGETPNTFTYPYGRFSKNTDAILKKMGFKATLSCKYGVNLITDNPETLYGLKRICRSHGKSIEKVLKNGMETLKYIKSTENTGRQNGNAKE